MEHLAELAIQALRQAAPEVEEAARIRAGLRQKHVSAEKESESSKISENPAN